MSNFRLNLPIDIPWRLIDSSADMVDTTFCNKRYPPPFRSSIAVYAYEPKADELPAEMCGDRISYLKISCSITGYQPTPDEKEQIVGILEKTEVNFGDIDQIVNEYFGCYGVLLNVSVHPFEDAQAKDIYTYPRIVDFEPKLRDFYQAATETGEVLTASVSRVSVNKSFQSTDSTQTSWNAEASAKVPAEAVGAATGVPVEIGATGKTGQVRTETDQENWGVTTDASRERREGQSTTTQLSQMYNLLTGYHTGTNRAAFIMLPRPHILQPTNRRTFVQGLRVIEGVQDFFLVVVRPQGQDRMKVDVFLQTGHFPEHIEVRETVPELDQFEYKTKDVDTFEVKCLGLGLAEGAFGAVVDAVGGEPSYVRTDVTNGLQTYDGFEADGWEFDPNEGDSGHKGLTELEKSRDTLDDYDGISFLKHTYKTVSPDQVQIEVSVKNKNTYVPFTEGGDAATLAKFHRKYKVHLRRRKKIDVTEAAAVTGLLITQRSLCTQIKFGDCITRIPFKKLYDDHGIVFEPPFEIGDLYDIPISIDKDEVTSSIRPKEPRFDFAFKKAILRKIQASMVSTNSSPFRYDGGGVGYLQSKHFKSRVLKVLDKTNLDKPVRDLTFVNPEVRRTLPAKLSLRELLSEDDLLLAKKFSITREDLKTAKGKLFQKG